MMKKIYIAGLLFVAGCTVFVIGSPYYRVFPTNWNQTFYLGLTVFFLALTMILSRSEALSRFRPAAYSFLIASFSLVVLKAGIFNLSINRGNPLQEIALDKFSQFLHIVPVIIGLTLLARKKLGTIFLQTGQLKAGLTFGIISFLAWSAIAYVINRTNTDFLAALFKGLPWLLLFIFANSIMEELWFRGIFLNNFASLIGKTGAIIVTSLVFGLSHINATYAFPGGGLVFGVVVLILGVVGAYAMQKDDSLIGPVLFHAGYDLLIIVPVLNSL